MRFSTEPLYDAAREHNEKGKETNNKKQAKTKIKK